jgi:beta-phosphoglucomutase-like phosphatase (HAD superfamily)
MRPQPEVARIHGIGPVPNDGSIVLLASFDFPGLGPKEVGAGGVTSIAATRDRRALFLSHGDHTLVYLPTAVGLPTYYPLRPAPLPDRIRAVLMDLDGTSVHSESFWISIIERVARRLLGDESFRFSERDLPFVSGFSVSEHLEYCLRTYCQGAPGARLEKAREYYFEITEFEMREIMEGRGRKGAFTPSPWLKEFLLNLKERGIKIGLVTSGLYQKAWPEIKNAFDTLELGDPTAFYDSIVTAGTSIKKGQVGTLGEQQAKPHPWLYSEVMMPFGLPPEEVIGLEDSSPGVISIRLAGVAAIGVEGGNILPGGAAPLCAAIKPDLRAVWEEIVAERC